MLHRIGFVSSVAALIASAVAALPASAAAAPAVPSPTTVACGAVVTQSVTLAGDVSCPSSQQRPAITVEAANITINLNGYTVSTASNAQNTIGILDSGYDGVTITNGTLDTFERAVLVRRASDTDLDGLSISGLGPYGGGIYIRGGTDNAIANSSVESLSSAVQVVNSSHVLITDTTSEDDFGGSFFLESNHGVLRDDTGGADGSAYYIAGSYNQIIDAHPAGGARNGPLEVASGTRNLVEGGSFSGTIGDGINVDAAAVDTTIEQTTDDHNMGAGIYVDSASTRLIDNHANDNDQNGIYAAVSGVYAVGNEARGNGAEPQCVNVSCR